MFQEGRRNQLTKIKPLIRLLRPFTLFAPAIGGFFFGLMGIHDAGKSAWDLIPLLFASGFILAMANATSNILNQAFDLDTDSLHPVKKRRPIPSGEVSQGEALSFAVILLICTLFLALTLFGPIYGVSLTVIMMFAWLYNCPPLRMKKRFILSNIAIAAPRGGLGVTCAYSAFASPWNPVMYVAILYFALYVFGTNTMKDFADEKYDRAVGVRNFVTVLGQNKAKQFVAIFLVIPFFFLAVAITLLGISPYTILPAIISIPMYYFMFLSEDHKGIEGNSILWTLFYLQFATMMVLFVLPRILT